jgi:hypothetical protein
VAAPYPEQDFQESNSSPSPPTKPLGKFHLLAITSDATSHGRAELPTPDRPLAKTGKTPGRKYRLRRAKTSAVGVGLQLGKFAILQFRLALRLVSGRKCRACIGYTNVIHMKQSLITGNTKYGECKVHMHTETTSELSNATRFKAVQDAVYKAASLYGNHAMHITRCSRRYYQASRSRPRAFESTVRR